LDLIEGFFSKLARSVLRHIRVASPQELRERLLDAVDRINRRPVVHTWKWRIGDAA
jgi:predicted DNA-binding transcriptional regulator YafY